MAPWRWRGWWGRRSAAPGGRTWDTAWTGLWGTIVGWFVRPALTTPLGVHLANGGRGSLAPAYLASAVVGGAGMAALARAGGSSDGAVLVLPGAPLAQILSAVLIERGTARRADTPAGAPDFRAASHKPRERAQELDPWR